jgi:ubiquitin-protein ligase
MSKSAKRIYTELNAINLENQKNSDSKKFIIDSTPFGGDESEPPTITNETTGDYYIVIGRILPTSNIYNQSAFRIKLKIPVQYPFKAPEVEMLTPIYHPNIGPEGKY